MSDHSDFSHGVRFSYWRGHTAATPETADRCRLECWPQGSCGMSFEWPGEADKIDALKLMISRVFEVGQKDGKRQVRDALGIVEPRR